MTEARPSNYWISSNAIIITRNAMGNPDYIQCNVVSNSYILCYMPGIAGLGYDAGHNYKRWPLSAAPTFFEENTAKYVYVAIPRTEAVGVYAPIVFPSEKVDIYGVNEAGEQKGSTDYYYIFLQGILSASVNADGTAVDREWKPGINTGTLSSDEALNAGGVDSWWKYSSVDDTVRFTKTISSANFEQATISCLFFNGDKQSATGFARDISIDYVSSEKIATAKYVTDYADANLLSSVHNDVAKGLIDFERGWTAGGYVAGAAGAAVTADGRAEVGTLTARGRVDVGTGGYIAADGTARLGDATVAAVRSPGTGMTDRVLVGGRGFELYVGSDGRSHLWVDNANVRGKLAAAAMEVRKVSYSGGTLLLSNAGSTLARVGAVRRGGQVVAYKCWAKADDGTTRTRNWWKVGMMALCQTYNVGGAGGNRRYWRLVVGAGQEMLDDGRWYDWVLLSAVASFHGGAAVVPSFGAQTLTDGGGRVLAFGGVAPVMVTNGEWTSLARLVLAQDGTLYDDDGTHLARRNFYGYQPGDDGGEPDVPVAGDVIVQCGDQVRWNSRGNVIRLSTSADDTDDAGVKQVPSLAMYHGIGCPRTGTDGKLTVWLWRELTALLSPEKTYINSDYFCLFSAEDGLEKAINPYAKISQIEMDSSAISATVTDVRTGLTKAGVVLDGENSYVNVTADTFYVTASDGTRTAAVDKEGSFRTTSLHTESVDKKRCVDIEDGMMVFATADSKAQIKFGLDGNGQPLLMFLKANGEVGYVLSANGGSKDVPAVTGEALVGDVTGGFSTSQQTLSMPNGVKKTMLALSYRVALTVRNVSGNAKTMNGNVVRVTVEGPSKQTWRLTSDDEKLLLNGDTLDMTYTYTVMVSATASDGTLITVPDTAAVTVTADDGSVIGEAVIGKDG